MSTEQTPPSPPGGSGTPLGGETGATTSAGERATEQAREAGQQASEAVRQAVGQARGRARQELDNRTTQMGERISATAQDVRTVGDQLRKQGNEGPAKLAEQIAERAEGAGEYLKGADADRILGDIESFARQRPWAVVAGGLTLGFVASRLIKASSGERYSSSRSNLDKTAEPYGRSPSSSYGTATPPGPGSTPAGVDPEISGAQARDPLEPAGVADASDEYESSIGDQYGDDPTRSRPAPKL